MTNPLLPLTGHASFWLDVSYSHLLDLTCIEPLPLSDTEAPCRATMACRHNKGIIVLLSIFNLPRICQNFKLKTIARKAQVCALDLAGIPIFAPSLCSKLATSWKWFERDTVGRFCWYMTIKTLSAAIGVDFLVASSATVGVHGRRWSFSYERRQSWRCLM